MARSRSIVKVGNVLIGGNHPIVIQSMTNTDTSNIGDTVDQIMQLADAGSEIVRVTVNDHQAAKSIASIKNKLQKLGYETPIVGCFHYNGHILLQEVPQCLEYLDKIRINPGNVGFGKKRDLQFDLCIEKAIEYNKPVRIGVNWGSLDQEILKKLMDENAAAKKIKSAEEIMVDALVESTITSAKRAENLGLTKDKIIVSCKTSKVQDLVKIYQRIANLSDYALHLGLTEAGMGQQAVIASSAALSILLSQGIGDTIRVSITPKPGEPRTAEVKICRDILQSLNIRNFTPQIVSCPGCGRTSSNYFQVMTQEITEFVEKNMPVWQRINPKICDLKIAVMGCIVNGPGESKHADIGISLPGNGENPVAPVFIDGKKEHTLRGNNLISDFKSILSNYIEKKC